MSAAIAVLVGLVVLFGWFSDIAWIGGLLGTVRMKANTASSFVLLGFALASLAPERIGRRRKVFGMACASVAALVGLATLGEWIFNLNLRIDLLLFTEKPGAVGTSEPGRMAATTAICFFLGGTAICLLRVREAAYAQALTLAIGLAALLAFITLLFDAGSMGGAGRQTAMAVLTAIAFLGLCVGVLSARSGGLMSDVRSRRLGGTAARFLLPAAIVVEISLGWLALHGEGLGLYSGRQTHALLATANIAVLAAVIWVTARLLNKGDAKAERQHAYLEAIVGSASDAILTRLPDGSITTWNHSAEQLFGYTATEVVGRRDVFLAPPELQTEVERAFEQLEGSTQPGGIETIRIAKDGNRIPVSISRFQILDDAAGVLGNGSFIRDITRQVEGQKALAESERKLRLTEMLNQQAMELEVSRAADVQRALLPTSPFEVRGFGLAGRCLPAKIIGGDCYDWWENPAGTLHVVVADVMGKGLRAALLMTAVRTGLRVASCLGDPVDVISALETSLASDLHQTETFVTLFYGQIDLSTRVIRYIDAGHALAFCISPEGAGRRLRTLDLPLGTFQGAPRLSRSEQFDPDDVLLVCSDGVLESLPDLNDCPADLFARIASAASAADGLDRVFETAPKAGSLDDDMTALLVRFTSASVQSERERLRLLSS